MKLKTLKKWNKKGRKIIKGQKATAFNNKGKALFAKYQTEPMPDYDDSYPIYPYNDDMDDYAREMDYDLATAFGLNE